MNTNRPRAILLFRNYFMSCFCYFHKKNSKYTGVDFDDDPLIRSSLSNGTNALLRFFHITLFYSQSLSSYIRNWYLQAFLTNNDKIALVHPPISYINYFLYWFNQGSSHLILTCGSNVVKINLFLQCSSVYDIFCYFIIYKLLVLYWI